jgi:hypothetical protein
MSDKHKDALYRILQDSALPDEEPGRAAQDTLQREFQHKLQVSKWITWVCIALDALIMIMAWNMLCFSSGTKTLIISATLFLFAFEGTCFIKLWYWVVHTRLNAVKEMKEMRLQVAELTTLIEQALQQPKQNG